MKNIKINKDLLTRGKFVLVTAPLVTTILLSGCGFFPNGERARYKNIDTNSPSISDQVQPSDNKNSIDEIIDCSNYKLAIVDDDSLDIKVTLKLLKKYNFNIEVITSTVDFINKIKCEEKYDLVFLDHKMPVFDGVRTLKSLKQLESYELPKFVCFTANAINGAREYYRSEGFDEYLAKPIDVKELDRIIKKFCKK